MLYTYLLAPVSYVMFGNFGTRGDNRLGASEAFFVATAGFELCYHLVTIMMDMRLGPLLVARFDSVAGLIGR